MIQEDKDLLFQDICARLPYGVRIDYKGEIYSVLGISHGRLVLCKPFMSQTLGYCPLIEEVKPYLFPFSGMTEEQEIEYDATFETIVYEDGKKDSVMTYKSFDCLNKNHFDYRSLIPKGLAINATGKNIY